MPTLTRVVTNNTILASDINGIMAIVSRAASETEVGKYFLGFWGAAVNDAGAQYMSSLSRGTTPASVTLDEADQAHSNCNTFTATNITGNGWLAFTRATGAATTCQVGGNQTINF